MKRLFQLGATVIFCALVAFTATPSLAKNSSTTVKKSDPFVEFIKKRRAENIKKSAKIKATKKQRSKKTTRAASKRKASKKSNNTSLLAKIFNPKKKTSKVKSKVRKVSAVKKARYNPRSGKKGSATRYHNIIARHARANGVPIKLAKAVIKIESNFNPNARGGVGEIGLMQLRFNTARGVGYRGSKRGLYNPETNIKFGMKYLGKARKLAGGSLCGTILKYNAGHGAKRMNKISANYCRKVKRVLAKS